MTVTAASDRASEIVGVDVVCVLCVDFNRRIFDNTAKVGFCPTIRW